MRRRRSPTAGASLSLTRTSAAKTIVDTAAALPSHFVLALTGDVDVEATSDLAVGAASRRRRNLFDDLTASVPVDQGLAPPGLYDALILILLLLIIVTLGFCHMTCLQTVSSLAGSSSFLWFFVLSLISIAVFFLSFSAADSVCDAAKEVESDLKKRENKRNKTKTKQTKA